MQEFKRIEALCLRLGLAYYNRCMFVQARELWLLAKKLGHAIKIHEQPDIS